MIKLVPDPTFEQDVSIAVPGSDAGQVVKFTCLLYTSPSPRDA